MEEEDNPKMHTQAEVEAKADKLWAAIEHADEMMATFDQETEEGRRKWSILNSIRNRLVGHHNIFLWVLGHEFKGEPWN